MRVRLIFNGQELRQNDRSLQSYNIRDNCVVHCLVTDPPPQEPAADAAQQEDEDAWDVGHLMLPMFAVVLALLWYFRIAYRMYFTTISSLILVVFTSFFVVAVLLSRRPTAEENLE